MRSRHNMDFSVTIAVLAACLLGFVLWLIPFTLVAWLLGNHL